MKIKIEDKTYVESDGMQFIVKKYTGNFTTDKKGIKREGYQTLGYYGTIEQLINGLINAKVFESNATTFNELLNDMRDIRNEVQQLLNRK